MSRRLLSTLVAALLGACASGPPAPDWQMNAHASLERAVVAHLGGDSRIEALEFERARSEIARTGRADLMARAELKRCAARVASLVFEPCAGFDALRPDAAAPEQAYADYLSGRAPQIVLLPSAQRGAATASAETAATALAAIDDPLSRLVAAGVMFESGRAGPAVIRLAVDTASAQGWRRPLLAWLKVELGLAERSGDAAAAVRLQRRIALVEGLR